MTDKTNEKKNIHDGHRERLREKARVDTELTALQDHEILELMLSLVIPRKDTNPLAHELIDKFGSLDGVLHAPPAQLEKVKSMTKNAAFMLSVLYPVCRRALQSAPDTALKPSLATPERCIEFMHRKFIGRREENVYVMLLDINYKVLYSTFKTGSASRVAVEPGELVSAVTRHGASYVLIAHNHPSGDVTPSFEDLDLTKVLIEALATLEVRLLDHVIFSDYNCFSFHNNDIIRSFEDELDERGRNNLTESTELRRKFITSLNEYALDASDSTEKSLSAVLMKGLAKKRTD